MSEQTASQQRRADLDKSQDQVAAMFDDVSSRYDVMNALLSGGMNFVWLKALTNALAPKPSDRILDLAAGTGASSAEIARSGARVVACDLSAGMIEVGRNRHPDIEFIQGDAMDLPFEDQSFDAVTIPTGCEMFQIPSVRWRKWLELCAPVGDWLSANFRPRPLHLCVRGIRCTSSM